MKTTIMFSLCLMLATLSHCKAANDRSYAVAVDALGNAYISGTAYGSLEGPNAGGYDAFLTKFDSSGNELWGRQIGTSGDDYSLAVAVDALGNAYISGSTKGSLEGPYAGGNDAFLTKFDSSGNELWGRQIGTSSGDQSNAVAVDALGNAYISGYTYGSLEGPNAGDADAFLTKFDSSGNELWGRQIGTSSGDFSYAVAVDALGNAYISGQTSGSLEGPNAGYADAFLTKFDSSGNELWGRQIGTSSGDHSHAVAVDALGNAYISGYTYGSLEGSNAGGYDAFLTKFDSSGNELWGRQIGTSSGDHSHAVAVDALGNAYISGRTSGSLEGPNAGSYDGSYDAFLTKFDSSGNELWGRQIGTSVYDLSLAVAVDALGNAYISGWTEGSLEGPNAGDADAFLTKFDSSGNELWGRQIGIGIPDPEPGDFDFNGIVDGEDFLLWQRNPSVGSLADWEANYGTVTPLSAASTAVPEPHTLLLASLASMGLTLRRRGLTR